MKYNRTYNFSAGPATMPEPVLEEIRDEMMNYRGSGMCVMEMSHRSPVYQQIIDEAEQDLRDLMHIPDNYKVLFIQGGATLQFAMIPMNLMKNGVACYVETGAWSKKAIAEAKKYGDVHVVASSKDRNYCYVPNCDDLDIPENTDYVYICENETIHGVTWNKLPNTKGHVLVSDQSSMFLSKPCNVSDYGLIYAGVQKNVGPAGMVVVIIREDLIRDDAELDPKTPLYMSYKTHADNGSMYNTPNCWAIYCCGKVFKYLKSIGGLEAMEKLGMLSERGKAGAVGGHDIRVELRSGVCQTNGNPDSDDAWLRGFDEAPMVRFHNLDDLLSWARDFQEDADFITGAEAMARGWI